MKKADRFRALSASITRGETVDWDAVEKEFSNVEDRELFSQLLQLAGISSLETGSESLKPPESWGHLKLLEPLGSGAFGVVWRALETRLDSEVALKLVPISKVPAGSNSPYDEAQHLARIRHTNVLTVHGVEIRDGWLGMWTELIRGVTLEDLLDTTGPMSAGEAATVGTEICRALAALHNEGLIHGDIKCQNIMRDVGGRIVLMDFGLVQDRVKPSEASGSNRLRGTPLYMSPGLLSGERPTVASDIYALSVVLYRMVTGSYPVEARSLEELVDLLERNAVNRLLDRRADLPSTFVQIVERGLGIAGEERYQTVGALEASLAGFLSRSDSPSRVAPMASGGSSEPFDFTAYRRDRIAEWSQSRYQLNKEFVALTLLIDQGQESASGRWTSRPKKYRDLAEVLSAVNDPAIVILGQPGSGKSTLLRRLELDVSDGALKSDATGNELTFFVQLNQYKAPGPGESRPEPLNWLATRWRRRFPGLPSLESLLEAGRMILLLDGLNEIPTSSPSELREVVLQWKGFLDRLMEEHPGNRVAFSCRTLDYSAPLSSPSLPVPQVVIQPMENEQVERFLIQHSPHRGADIWKGLRGTSQLEMMRSPYFLSLLVDQVEAGGKVATGRAELFTGFVRQALRREVERDHPLFAPNDLLSERDVRRLTQWKWSTGWELPERGLLVPKLSELAYRMQDQSGDGGASQVRVGVDDALDILASDRADDIVEAGAAISVLDEDPKQDELLFFHQLLQEYFAGRYLARNPMPERLRTKWRHEEVPSPVREILENLPPAETLPELPTTGWEETALMAAAMTKDPDGFVRGLMKPNLALAGRCAGQPEVRDRLSAERIDELRSALLERSRHRSADLRARIAAGLALGQLGDPRFERCEGPQGSYIQPPMVEIPGGTYPIGDDDPIEWMGQVLGDHVPRHNVEVATFWIGRYPVTNAEWSCFQHAGGYEDERWWDTESARAWRRGEGVAELDRAGWKGWVAHLREHPETMDLHLSHGRMTEEEAETWKRCFDMTDTEIEAEAMKRFPDRPLREPFRWCREPYGNPSQPVVGLCWYEARAFTNWLAAQATMPYRLPTEAEWECAARGTEARRYSWGDEFDPLLGNTPELRLRRPAPVGLFPDGETPEGVSDLTSNVSEWTSTRFDEVGQVSGTYKYPYRTDDGRESLEGGRRVARGGSYYDFPEFIRASFRQAPPAGARTLNIGFRLALDGAS